MSYPPGSQNIATLVIPNKSPFSCYRNSWCSQKMANLPTSHHWNLSQASWRGVVLLSQVTLLRHQPPPSSPKWSRSTSWRDTNIYKYTWYIYIYDIDSRRERRFWKLRILVDKLHELNDANKWNLPSKHMSLLILRATRNEAIRFSHNVLW